MEEQQPGGARRSQEEPGGARRSQEEPGSSQEEPGSSQEEPEAGEARRSQKEPIDPSIARACLVSSKCKSLSIDDCVPTTFGYAVAVA